jgi:Secretion system C-terminal sorting domain
VRQEICGYVKFDTVNIYMNGVSIQDYSVLIDQLTIAPSPATDVLHLKLPGSSLNESFDELRIYSAEGQLMRNYEFTEEVDLFISIRELSNGIYTLKIRHRNSGIEHSKKIVVLH